MSGYYAVAKGHHPGIYQTWDECQRNVKGFSGAVYKKFKTLKDAKDFICNPKESTSITVSDVKQILPEDAVVIFTDGACQNQGSKSKTLWRGGYGYYIPSLEKRCFGRVPAPCTNNRAELFAIIQAVTSLPKETKIHIITDSKYSYLILTGTGKRYASQNYQDRGQEVLNCDLVRQAVNLLDEYSLSFTHVFAHTGLTDELSRGNHIADQLAVKGAELDIMS